MTPRVFWWVVGTLSTAIVATAVAAFVLLV
jgi:hypothetical protein